MRKNPQLFLFLLAFLVSCTNNNSRNVSNTTQNDTTNTLTKPSKETTETDTTTTVFVGDLNGDSQKDKIEVVEKKCTENDDARIENAQCRTVVIYLAKMVVLNDLPKIAKS